MMRGSFWVSLALLCGLSFGGCPFHSPPPDSPQPTQTMQGQIPGATNASDPFVFANNFFQSTYSESGEALRPDPIIILEGDYLVLFQDGQRTPRPVINMTYHNLKMVCHFVLGTFMITLPDLYNTTAPVALSNTTLTNLSEFEARVKGAQANLMADPTRFIAGDQLGRQHRIITSALTMLNTLLTTATSSVAAMTNFTRGNMPDITDNLNEAGAVQMRLTFDVMESWRTGTLADVWEDVKVTLTTSHMARRANSFAQFMARYFDVDIVQSTRFVLLESISSEAAAMALLDTHKTDYGIGMSFFDDEWRMHEDALCGAAKLELDKMFPSSAATSVGCLKEPPNPSHPML